MKLHPHFLLLIFAPYAFCAEPTAILVKPRRVLDVSKGIYVENVGIWIEGQKIKDVGPSSAMEARIPKKTEIIDLAGATVLPGLIDCHTHLMERLPSMSNFEEDYILTLA